MEVSTEYPIAVLHMIAADRGLEYVRINGGQMGT